MPYHSLAENKQTKNKITTKQQQNNKQRLANKIWFIRMVLNDLHKEQKSVSFLRFAVGPNIYFSCIYNPKLFYKNNKNKV